jgi:hypothetical protein
MHNPFDWRHIHWLKKETLWKKNNVHFRSVTELENQSVWPLLFKAMTAQHSADVRNKLVDGLHHLLMWYNRPVPEDLSDLLSRGLQCTCSEDGLGSMTPSGAPDETSRKVHALKFITKKGAKGVCCLCFSLKFLKAYAFFNCFYFFFQHYLCLLLNFFSETNIHFSRVSLRILLYLVHFWSGIFFIVRLKEKTANLDTVL